MQPVTTRLSDNPDMAVTRTSWSRPSRGRAMKLGEPGRAVQEAGIRKGEMAAAPALALAASTGPR
jgi:hypothetical protein